MADENSQKYSIDEICLLGEVTKRTLRYYVQEKLIDNPLGESKRTAYYTTKHLEQLLTIRKYRNIGVSLEGIRELMQTEQEAGPVIPSAPKRPGTVAVWSHVHIANGLELHIQPEQARLSPENLRELVKQITIAYKDIQGDTP
ncbi:MerR family transcriptional regulator [bacterium]|nr:MerR family transcriptional regulator [bacterium]